MAGCTRLSGVRSLAEIEAIRATGRALARSLDVFAQHARPSTLGGDAVARVERFLASMGCEARVGLVVHDGALGPAALVARFAGNDITTLHVAAHGSSGYWYELSGVFAFDRLPPAFNHRLLAVERAYQAGMLVMAPGATPADVRAAVDGAVAACGLGIDRRQRVDCHPLRTTVASLDPGADEWTFEPNEVVVFHPCPLADGDSTFRISETVLIRPDGAVPMSPRGSIFRRISI